jgi:malonyl-CoA O-methyltransferase
MANLFQSGCPLHQAETPIVFLPGWGFDDRILRLMHPVPSWTVPVSVLDPETFESDLLHFLASNELNKINIIGWSMGGMLGLHFAGKYPDKIDSLILTSLRAEWPRTEIAILQKAFAENPGNFLQDFFRKCFLGDRDLYREFRRNLEQHYLTAADMHIEVLQRGLKFLSEFTPPDNTPANVPVRLIHGKQDIIAPVKEMLTLEGADIEVIENSGHMVFLDERCSLQVELRKKTIREKFSRAADSYDTYAIVQAEVARRLASRLNSSKTITGVRTILELGCGTGNFTAHLAERFPDARITALDFSGEMLALARRKLNNNNIEFICTEGEDFLDKAPGDTYDLVASNGSLQWFADHDRSLKNIARILMGNGVFLCSIFGPESLKKLGQGLKQLFGYPGNVAAGSFPDVDRLRNILEAYFTSGSAEQELIEKEYDSVRDLLVHIKKTGTGGWHKQGSPVLTISRLNQLDNWFVQTYGGCKVNYQVHFLKAVK